MTSCFEKCLSHPVCSLTVHLNPQLLRWQPCSRARVLTPSEAGVNVNKTGALEIWGVEEGWREIALHRKIIMQGGHSLKSLTTT